MRPRQKLRRALDMLSEGRESDVPRMMRDEAEVLCDKATNWLQDRGIQGLGIAYRRTKGKQLPQLALKVYVAKKLPKSKVKNLVPMLLRIGSLGADVEIDVEEVGELRLHGNEERMRPVTPGFGVSPAEGGAGTIGCLVRKAAAPGEPLLFGAGHTFLFGRSGSVGDRLFQPAIEDDGAQPGDGVAEVTAVTALEFDDASFKNFYDTALARLDSGLAVDPAIPEIGVPSGVHTSLRAGMRVQKTGRTTGHTVGKILDIDFRTAFRFRVDGAGTEKRAGFRSQVLCTHYADPGDSGAAVLSMTGKLVGVHLAGSATRSVFSRALPAMRSLGVELMPAPGD